MVMIKAGWKESKRTRDSAVIAIVPYRLEKKISGIESWPSGMELHWNEWFSVYPSVTQGE